jgi:hypothetical protein
MYKDEILASICIALAITGLILLYIGGQQNNDLPKLIVGGVLLGLGCLISFIYAYKTRRFG